MYALFIYASKYIFSYRFQSETSQTLENVVNLNKKY